MKGYLRLWGDLLRLSWKRVPGLTACLLGIHFLSVGAVATTALTLRGAVDAALHGRTQAAVAAAAGVALAYAVTAVLDNSVGNLQVLCLERVALTDLHTAIHLDIARLDTLEHLERSEYLDRVTLVRGSAWQLVAGMWTAVGTVFTFAQLVVSLGLLGAVSPWLLFLLLLAIVPLWCDRRGRQAVNTAELASAESDRLQKHLFDLCTSPQAGKEIRVAAAGGELARRQRSVWDEVTALRFRARVAAAAWKLAGWGVFTAGFTAALGLVVHEARTGRGTAGDVVMAVTVASTLRHAVHQAVTRAAETAGAGRLIEPYLWLREYTRAESERAPKTSPVPRSLREGITLDRVGHSYPGSGRSALQDVSAHLPAGAVVAVVGEYGSGKTTLVKLLCKLYDHDEGSIRVDGNELRNMSTEAWRARTSAAFQDFGRFRTTFSEAVGMGDLTHVDDTERITAAVAEAGAQSLVERLPQGTATQLGREFGGVELSEGQWQKTALARAVMRPDPLLFVLDEPTASLDAPSEEEVFRHHMERARRVGRATGAVTVVVSHRFSTVTQADLILVLDKGRLVETGDHAELMALGGLYAELFTLQASAYSIGGSPPSPTE